MGPCILVGIFAVGWCVAHGNGLTTQNSYVPHVGGHFVILASIFCHNTKQQSPLPLPIYSLVVLYHMS